VGGKRANNNTEEEETLAQKKMCRGKGDPGFTVWDAREGNGDGL